MSLDTTNKDIESRRLRSAQSAFQIVLHQQHHRHHYQQQRQQLQQHHNVRLPTANRCIEGLHPKPCNLTVCTPLGRFYRSAVKSVEDDEDGDLNCNLKQGICCRATCPELEARGHRTTSIKHQVHFVSQTLMGRTSICLIRRSAVLIIELDILYSNATCYDSNAWCGST